MIRLSFSTEMLPAPAIVSRCPPSSDDALKLPRPLITFGVDEY